MPHATLATQEMLTMDLLASQAMKQEISGVDWLGCAVAVSAYAVVRHPIAAQGSNAHPPGTREMFHLV